MLKREKTLKLFCQILSCQQKQAFQNAFIDFVNLNQRKNYKKKEQNKVVNVYTRTHTHRGLIFHRLPYFTSSMFSD
jgi:hypothetical protein